MKLAPALLSFAWLFAASTSLAQDAEAEAKKAKDGQAKAERALDKERERVDELQDELRERESAESARRFIRYGVTAGVAYSIYAPMPAPTRLAAVQGGSVTGYLATFPAYWGWSAPTANYCAAQWSASEEAAKALERLSAESESVTTKELAAAEARRKDEAEKAEKAAQEKKKELDKKIEDVAPWCSPGERPPRKPKNETEWKAYCQVAAKEEALRKLTEGKETVPKADLEKLRCPGAAAANDPTDAKDVVAACKLDDGIRDLAHSTDKVHPLVEEYNKLAEALEVARSAQEELGQERVGSTYADFKNARARYRDSKYQLSIRETLAREAWEQVKQACDNNQSYEVALLKVGADEFEALTTCATSPQAKKFESEARKVLELRAKTANGDPTTPVYECLLSKVGIYVGVAGSFNATVILPEEPEQVLRDREVTPTITFGLAFAPNALFTVLTGPMVGSVNRQDGTDAPIWAWAVAFGGTLDIVNLLTPR